MIIFRQTQVTTAFVGLVRLDVVYNVPGKLVRCAAIFQGPYQARYFGLASVLAVSKGGLMLCVTCLKRVLRHTYVVGCFVVILDGDPINYIGFETLVFYWA